MIAEAHINLLTMRSRMAPYPGASPQFLYNTDIYTETIPVLQSDVF
jgi:hypothetical protein